MPTKEELIKYAIIVRKKCLRYAFTKEAKKTPYYKEKKLMCMCAVASATLVQYLKNKGISSYCVATRKHCWVSVEKYFIDITCSQYYGMSDYLIMEKADFLDFVSSNYCYNDYKKIIDYSYFETWGEGQGPVQKVINKILKIKE